ALPLAQKEGASVIAPFNDKVLENPCNKETNQLTPIARALSFGLRCIINFPDLVVRSTRA
ncbi:MAG: hypothetical protein IJK78_12860, partial [Bacteroidales bacterium]|nr:hypothetical protein [Bacteroidales bacterium]